MTAEEVAGGREEGEKDGGEGGGDRKEVKEE